MRIEVRVAGLLFLIAGHLFMACTDPGSGRKVSTPGAVSKPKDPKAQDSQPGELRACNPSEVRRAEGVTPTQRPFFYRITGRGVDSFLLGTIHVGFSLKDLPSYVESSLRRSDRLLGERKFDFETIRANLNLKNTGVWPKLSSDGISRLPENDLDTKERLRMTCLGVPESLTRVLTDKACMLVMMGTYYERAMMDLEALNHFYSVKRPIEQLDSDELLKEADQLEVKVGGGGCELKKILAYPPEQVSAAVSPLFKRYQEGDESSFVDESDRAVKHRNVNWIPIIESEMQKGRVFITMGAAHLFGSKGVIPLLREKGYEVKRWLPAQATEVSNLNDQVYAISAQEAIDLETIDVNAGKVWPSLLLPTEFHDRR